MRRTVITAATVLGLALGSVAPAVAADDAAGADDQAAPLFDAKTPASRPADAPELDFLGAGEISLHSAARADASRATAARGAATNAAPAAADASLSADVVFQAEPGGTTEPLSDIDVALWRLDEGSGYYDYVDGGSVVDGMWDSPAIEAGTYAVQFVADPYSGIGSEYYADARYWGDRTDVVVASADAVDLGTVTLEPRYFDTGRIAGDNRFQTAVAATQALYGDGDVVPVVYLTNGYTFPDALSAGPAAGYWGGAILPVRQNALPGAVEAELVRLQPERVVIVGTESSVSAGVEGAVAALLGSGTVVDRIGGAQRYETSRLIVEDAFPYGSQYAFIATGRNYPDALAAGAAAGVLGAPVILVDGTRDSLTPSQVALLGALGVEGVIIAGGPASVSNGIAQHAYDLTSGNVWRFAGDNRYQTAAFLNQAIFGEAEVSVVASGENFPDALVGGPLASALWAPLYLSKKACMPSITAQGLFEMQTQGVLFLGSEETLSQKVEQLGVC